MKHIKELKLNEEVNDDLKSKGRRIGYGWKLIVDDTPKKGKGKGITEPYFIVTNKNSKDDAWRLATKIFNLGYNLIDIKPLDIISNAVWIEEK